MIPDEVKEYIGKAEPPHLRSIQCRIRSPRMSYRVREAIDENF
ncbi:MAG: hypothetical protein WBC89_01730 [Dehalococcoidia bacterium]